VKEESDAALTRQLSVMVFASVLVPAATIASVEQEYCCIFSIDSVSFSAPPLDQAEKTFREAHPDIWWCFFPRPPASSGEAPFCLPFSVRRLSYQLSLKSCDSNACLSPSLLSACYRGLLSKKSGGDATDVGFIFKRLVLHARFAEVLLSE